MQFAFGPNSALEPFLYSVTPGSGTTGGVLTELNNNQPLPFSFSSNGESVEFAIPQSLLTRPTEPRRPRSISPP